MRVAVTGTHGLIAGQLLPALRQAGHTVVPLVRGSAKSGEVSWDPSASKLIPEDLSGIDAAIHLGGVGIFRRWSASSRAEIVRSRVESTDLLARTLAKLDPQPKVLLNASAIGWYGDRGDEKLDEGSGVGQGFLSDVCVEWEEATRPAVDAGIRTVMLRTGIVQSRSGGSLKAQLPIFSFGLGARLGSGRQWVSWISMADEVGAIIHALECDDLSGPVNLTGPEPITNADYTRALGRALHRPAVLTVPGFALAAVLGRDLAQEMLLGGQRVLPTKLAESGYQFRHRTLDEALAAELER